MLEGLAAVGAAAAVVQFVGYGYRVFFTSSELYRSSSGTLEHNGFLETITQDFKVLLERIKQSSTPSSQAAEAFRDDGLKLANEMLDGLEKLKLNGRPGKWKTLKKALKAVHSKEKVKSWERRLDTLRNQFNTHVEIDILERIDFVKLSMSTAFQELEVQQQQCLQVFMDAVCNRDMFEMDLVSQIQEVKDSNHVEYELTRTQMATDKLDMHETIKSEHEATRMFSTEEADDTRTHITQEHRETRDHISTGYDELRGTIQTGGAEVMDHFALQHEQTITRITTSIVEQITHIERNLNDESQQRLDFLEAELFRVQIENDSSLRRESVRTLEVLRHVASMSNGNSPTTVTRRLAAPRKRRVFGSGERPTGNGSPRADVASRNTRTASPSDLLWKVNPASFGSPNPLKYSSLVRQNHRDNPLHSIATQSSIMGWILRRYNRPDLSDLTTCYVNTLDILSNVPKVARFLLVDASRSRRDIEALHPTWDQLRCGYAIDKTAWKRNRIPYRSNGCSLCALTGPYHINNLEELLEDEHKKRKIHDYHFEELFETCEASYLSTGDGGRVVNKQNHHIGKAKI